MNEEAQLGIESSIRPRMAGTPVPLTAMQLRVWSQVLERGKLPGARMCTVVTRILGPLNIELLSRSVEALVWRHETLRTRFVTVDGIPRQHVDSASACGLEAIELTGGSASAVEAQARRVVSEFVEESVDLSVGPLFATRLLRLSRHEHVLIFSLEHMITDDVSNQIIRGEIWTFYRQAARGLPFSLPELPLQFADYADWQERTHGLWREKHEGYWKGRLTGAPHISFPTDDLPKVKRPIEAMMQFPFGATLSASLRDLARSERTLLSLVVLAVYVAATARWCNRCDLVLTFVSNGRHRRGLQNMVGWLASPHRLRCRLTGLHCSALRRSPHR
jgi:Condensation domain